ncbi:hypothetical protein ACLESO_38300, partial [Pyxidicoccus sp. 3LG]
MKARSLVAGILSASVLSACSESAAPDPVNVNQAPYSDNIPEVRVPVSGVVFDPEALFFSFMTWPVPPEDPEGPPPPALLYGLPTVIRSAVWGARVELLGPDGQVADSSGPALPPWGNFQTRGLAPDASRVYSMRTVPTPELSVGAGDFFPEDQGFAPIPAVPYHATTTLRPVAPTGTQCLIQAPVMVGEAGALEALAYALSTETGTATTAADLASPSSGRSVVLLWVYSPSPVLDAFMFPSGDIAAETSVGTLYSFDWAFPSGAPGESRMGFTATRGGLSSLGYYAWWSPPGTAGEVEVNFMDTLTDPEQGGPGRRRPSSRRRCPRGVSFARLHAFALTEEPPP